MTDKQKNIDQAVAVRQGEELDLAALGAYLRAQIPDLEAAQLEVLQFPSGHSNLTYLLRIGERELVLRRPPFGAKIKTAHDMQREYHILACLSPVFSKAPPPLAYCADESVLGAPFYVMERLRGVILRGARPAGLELLPPVMQKLSENFVDNLVAIHRLDYQSAGLGSLGHPQGYARRQVEGWTQRYLNAKTDDIPEMLRVAAWLAEKLPPENPPALIHNDYKYDNLVLDPADLGQIIGVLDWEMATIGDPLMDLGTALGYWVDPTDPPELKALSFGLTMLEGNLTRRQVAERYAAQSGSDLVHLTFYYVYALFKIAVIVQQIYARYKAGFSHDERFAQMIDAVRVLSAAAVQAMLTGRV
jgi:aminoglycoside phosphotransferase (APT) family kinase protein